MIIEIRIKCPTVVTKRVVIYTIEHFDGDQPRDGHHFEITIQGKLQEDRKIKSSSSRKKMLHQETFPNLNLDLDYLVKNIE